MKLGSGQWGVNRNDPLARTLHRKGAVPLPGLPRWLSGWECTSRWRKHRFNPQVGKTPWRRKWQATPIFLPGESHWQRNLVGSVHGVAKSWTQLSTHACTHFFFHSHSPYTRYPEKEAKLEKVNLSEIPGSWTLFPQCSTEPQTLQSGDQLQFLFLSFWLCWSSLLHEGFFQFQQAKATPSQCTALNVCLLYQSFTISIWTGSWVVSSSLYSQGEAQ